MDSLSREEIWKRVNQITATYPLLECDRCAMAVARWLERWNVDYSGSHNYGVRHKS